MKVVDSDGDKLTIEVSIEELLMIMGGMREICFGVEFHAFDTRVGFSKEKVGHLVGQLKAIIDEQGIEE